jgi:AcrR family transcriptional regulator
MVEPPIPRKRPQQGRSIVLVNALKEACLNLLEREGRQSFSVAELCAESGVTSASFYEYFPNVESLVAAVLDDKLNGTLRELFEEANTIPVDTPLHEVIRRVVEVCVSDRLALYKTSPDVFIKYIEHFESTRQFESSALFTSDIETNTRLLLSRFEEQISTTDFDKVVSIFVSEVRSLTRWVVFDRRYTDTIDSTIEIFATMLVSLFEEKKET